MILATAHYFGADCRPGHYLFGPKMAPVYRGSRPFEMLDGQLAPRDVPGRGWGDKGQEILYQVQPWRLPALDGRDWSAIAWWDRTSDRRSGSNSIVFAPGLTVELEGMQQLFAQFFPEVLRRQPPLEYLTEWKERAPGGV